MKIDTYLQQKQKIINRALLKYLPAPAGYAKELISAMRYSVLAGGKRIRPILMLVIAEMFNKLLSVVLPSACAIEYIHTSTLILDDLPCMDNSDLRRGVASTHKRFGEATAILASYSLMVLAFELLAENAKLVSRNSAFSTNIIKGISMSLGFRGLCAGQFVDLKSGSKDIDYKTLSYLHRRKTADLFSASCRIAGCLCRAEKKELDALGRCGRYMGVAFQIHDDLLSIQKADRQLGKQTKKDANSPNFVNLFGMKKARGALMQYIKKASLELKIFNKKAKILDDILIYLAQRKK